MTEVLNISAATEAASDELAPRLECDMNLTAKASAWLDALRAVSIAVSRRPVVPILGSVLLQSSTWDEIRITGFDYATAVTAAVAGPFTSRGGSGAAAIPFEWLSRTIRTLTRGDTSVEVTVSTSQMMGGRMALVQAAGYTIPILCPAVRDYPHIPESGVLGTFTTDLTAFRNTLNSVAFAASKDETLPILGSIAMTGGPDGVQVMTTDRYRLAFNLVELEEGETSPAFTFNLPATFWKKLSKVMSGETLGVSVLVHGASFGHAGGVEALEFRSKGLTVTVLGNDGKYPEILRLLDIEAGATAVVGRTDLLRQARIAHDLGVRNCPAEVRVSVDGLSVTPPMDGAKEATAAPRIPATFHAITPDLSEVFTAFNPAYLLEAVKAIAADDLKFTFQSIALAQGASNPKPVILTASNKKHSDKSALRVMVMPVRLPDRIAT